MPQVDTWRAARTGFPEVIWGPGKSPEQLAAIMTRLAETEAVVVATRVTPEVAAHDLLNCRASADTQMLLGIACLVCLHVECVCV